MASIVFLKKAVGISVRNKSCPETAIALFEKERSLLPRVISALHSVDITGIWLSTSEYFEGAWVLYFPHREGEDPIGALTRVLGKLDN